MLRRFWRWLTGDYERLHLNEVPNPEQYFADELSEAELLVVTMLMTKPALAKKFSKRERDAIKLAWGEQFGEDDPHDY